MGIGTVHHDSIFEYIAVDINRSEKFIRELLFEKGKSALMELINQENSTLVNHDIVLGSPIIDNNGNVLINKGIAIQLFFSSLLDRYLKDPEFETEPFSIQPCENVLNSYRSKLSEKLKKSVGSAVKNNFKSEQMMKTLNADTGRENPSEMFDRFIGGMLSSANGISVMFKMMKNDLNKSADFGFTMDSTHLCMAVMDRYMDKMSNLIDKDAMVKQIGYVTFFQKVSNIMGEKKSSPIKSAEVASHCTKDKSIKYAIENQDNYLEDGVPFFKNKGADQIIFSRILMTVNVFLDIIKTAKIETDNMELYKALYDIADKGYIDRFVVKILSEMFLPKIKMMLLEYALKITDLCDQKNIIWNLIGDMVPVKFICERSGCEHSGLNRTLVPEDITIKVKDFYEYTISSGIYTQCSTLSEKLKVVYKKIVEMEKSGKL